MGWRDDWPSMPDGSEYNGMQLLPLVRAGKSPFQGVWDVNLPIREIEEHTNTKITDIATVRKGSNNYGLHLKASNRPDLMARLARGDVNMPDFDGFPIEWQAPEAAFEAAVYDLLRTEPAIRASRLIYHRVPVLHPGPNRSIPLDLAGRRLFVFEKAEGRDKVWRELSKPDKLRLLDQLATVQAALFHYTPPLDFAQRHLLDRLYDFMPETLSHPVAPTREFWLHVMEAKIDATIRNEGALIGWEDDHETVGPGALAAKKSLLRALPHLIPRETTDGSLYRLALDHGDFGVHNTTVKVTESKGRGPLVTSLFDWETGCIVPAILSDPLVAVDPVDLAADERGEPSVARIIPKEHASSDMERYTGWACHYIQSLYTNAPDYKFAIQAGKDIRH
ncbi:uncharacterized protein DSM5745_03255 [Aspergillus mulundensis]|uniref:Aminoglycoside phosphotransferase domain-containing protein n=1 Tax=Aspergillus mulundensis TaxID=1810919 RepID=A0A3D8SJY2_9EURO|nr:Uncharacterized protein DSM5745_03255 [Aspergillus mulundensis]RDW86613.1 Uncharacterized protein DSM5745_03255 [Aspergillus mulundensis]